MYNDILTILTIFSIKMEKKIIINPNVLKNAARQGDVNLLYKVIDFLNKYGLTDEKREMYLSSIIDKYIKHAINNNNILVIEHIMQIDNIDKHILRNIAKNAAKTNKLEIILILHKNGFTFDEIIGIIAAKYGSINVLMVLYDYDCKFNDETSMYALENGHLDCVEFLHKIGCPINVHKCNVTSDVIIQWGINNGIIFPRPRNASLVSRRNSFSEVTRDFGGFEFEVVVDQNSQYLNPNSG